MLSFINSDCDLHRREAYKIGLEFILVSWSDIILINAFSIHKVADKKNSIYSIGRRMLQIMLCNAAKMSIPRAYSTNLLIL